MFWIPFASMLSTDRSCSKCLKGMLKGIYVSLLLCLTFFASFVFLLSLSVSLNAVSLFLSVVLCPPPVCLNAELCFCVRRHGCSEWWSGQRRSLERLGQCNGGSDSGSLFWDPAVCRCRSAQSLQSEFTVPAER